MRLPDVIYRLLGRDKTDSATEHADQLLESVDKVKLTIVPKNQRAHAALRRLRDHAQQ